MYEKIIGIVGPVLACGYGIYGIVAGRLWLPMATKSNYDAATRVAEGFRAVLAGLYFIALGGLIFALCWFWWPAARAQQDESGPAAKRLEKHGSIAALLRY